MSHGRVPGDNAKHSFNGTDTLTYKAFDGSDYSDEVTVTFTIGAVNDVPSFTKGADQTVLEDAGPQFINGWATNLSAGPPDEAGQSVWFQASTDNISLFWAVPAIDGFGNLQFTPAPDAFGTATVTVVLVDGWIGSGGSASPAATFTINVNPVNDAPSFTKGADQTVNEDAGPQTSSGWAISLSAGPANEADQTLAFQVSSNTPSLFAVQPAIDGDGNLSYTLAAHANGVATVTVALVDDGGTANGGLDTSVAQSFLITVTAINDAPSFTKGADETVNEDAGPQTISGWAVDRSPGPVNEADQTWTFQVNADNPGLFAVAPAIDADGNLTYTTAPDANGVATVTVTLVDNGGTANGGVDTSAAQTFTITVNPVNDAPTLILSVSGTTIVEGAFLYVNGTIIDPDTGESFEVTIDWADGTTTTLTPGVGVTTFSASHQYLDDDPTDTSSDLYNVTVTATDSSNLSGTNPIDLTVNNVAPQLATFSVTPTPLDEGNTAVLSGTFADPGAHDSFTLTVSWGDTATETIYLPAGATSFTLTHIYLDDGPSPGNGTAVDFPTLAWTLTDDDNGVLTREVMLTVWNVDPEGVADVYEVWENGLLAGNVLTNDVDSPGDKPYLTAELALAPAYGTLVLFPNGAFIYTPDPDTYGADSFQYYILDDDTGVATGWVYINVLETSPPNHAPVALHDEYETDEDETLEVDAPGVLGNDSDQDGDDLTPMLTQGPEHGTLELRPDGSFTYMPDADWYGTDSFKYVALDGIEDSNEALVTIIVNPLNDAPLVADPGDQANYEGQDVSLSIIASDPDGDPLSFSVTGLPTGLSIDSETGLIFGTIATGAAGTYSVAVTVADIPLLGASLSTTILFAMAVAPPLTVGSVVDMKVAANASGKLEVFVMALMADPLQEEFIVDQVFSNTQSAENGTNWGGFGSLGSPLGQAFGDYGGFDVGRRKDGNLQLFVWTQGSTLTNTPSRMRTATQLTAGGAWSGWRDFEWAPSFAIKKLIVATNADDRLELIASTPDYKFYSNKQGPDGSWTGWAFIGVLGVFPYSIAKLEDVGLNQNDRLEIFATNTAVAGTALFSQTQNTVGGTWPGFAPVPRHDLTTVILDDGNGPSEPVSVGRDANGRLQVFWMKRDAATGSGFLYAVRQQTPSGFWGDNQTLAILDPTVKDLKVAMNTDGHFDVFARGDDNQIYSCSQSAVDLGTWSGFSSVGAPGVTLKRMVVAKNANGGLAVFALGSDLRVYWNHQQNGAMQPQMTSIGTVQ